MNFFDFIICTLAASAIVDCWFNGSIFAKTRQLVETKADWCEAPDEHIDLPEDATVEQIDSWVDKCPCIIAELLSCSFCMSHHTPLWVFAWYFGANLLPAGIIELARLPVYILAATRLGNLLTAYSKKPYQEPI